MNFIYKLVTYFKKPLEVTEWYPAEVKPVRQGVYQIKTVFTGLDEDYYAYWDGKQWVFEDAKDCPLKIQNREWRGIKK